MSESPAATTRTWHGVQIPAPGSFTIDAQHSHVGFVATHMMFTKVRGHFTEVTGTVTLAEDPVDSVVDILIATGSVTTGADDRDAHLRSADFFDSETYPQMRFRSTEIRHVSGSEFAVTGELTIRDVTRPLELAATFEGLGTNPWGVEVAGASARAVVNREDWGLTWNAALEAGGVLVGKNITLEIEIQAARA